MKSLVTILLLAIVALSSVCGACTVSCDKLYPTTPNKTVAIEEWTIEFNSTVADNSNYGENTEIIEVITQPQESLNNGEWTLEF